MSAKIFTIFTIFTVQVQTFSYHKKESIFIETAIKIFATFTTTSFNFCQVFIFSDDKNLLFLISSPPLSWIVIGQLFRNTGFLLVDYIRCKYLLSSEWLPSELESYNLLLLTVLDFLIFAIFLTFLMM